MKKRTNYAVKLLNHLAGQQQGMSFREMQQFLFALAYPGRGFTRSQRGWWCSALLGTQAPGGYTRDGLLHLFAYKDASGGRWYRNELVSHKGEPFRVVNQYNVDMFVSMLA
jgi:hypothetical protein